MATQTQNPGASIKQILKDTNREPLESRQKGIEEKYRKFIEGCEDGWRRTSATGSLYRLLGENNHHAEVTIYSMKETVRYLLAFLTQAETASQFEKFRGYHADDFGKHLLQLHECLDAANNSYALAEMGLYELDLALYSAEDLDNFEKDLEDFKKAAA